MIIYKHGDIFQGGEDVIVHGCNCFCTFGAGIALQVTKYYPDAFAEDKKTLVGDKTKLGTFTTVTCPHRFKEGQVTIVNAYTQYDCGAWKKPFDYDAFKTVCEHIKNRFGEKTIAMPKIGAGLAGGYWPRIAGIIEDVFGDKDIIVYLYAESPCGLCDGEKTISDGIPCPMCGE